MRRPFFQLTLPETCLPLLLELGGKVETEFPLFVLGPVTPKPLQAPTGLIFYLQARYRSKDGIQRPARGSL